MVSIHERLRAAKVEPRPTRHESPTDDAVIVIRAGLMVADRAADTAIDVS